VCPNSGVSNPRPCFASGARKAAVSSAFGRCTRCDVKEIPGFLADKVSLSTKLVA
jgi:hypothetical protein